MESLEQQARAAARRHGVDEDVFLKLVSAESAWNPRAVSRVGARGLTQLMPDTARGLGVKDSFDVQQSLEGGARYLAQQLKAFGGDYEKALAAYNAGPGNVRKYGGIPPFRETQAYVRKILGSGPPSVARGTSAPDEYSQAFADIPQSGSAPQTLGDEEQAFSDLPDSEYETAFADLPAARATRGRAAPKKPLHGPPAPLTPEAARKLVLKDLGGRPAEDRHLEALYATAPDKVEKSIRNFSSFSTLYDLHDAMKKGEAYIRKAEGVTSVRIWRKHLAAALGVKPEQVTAKTVARLIKVSPSVGLAKEPPKLGGLQGWLVSLLPEGEVTYSGSLGAISRAVGDVPRLIQEGATRLATGGKIGERELNEHIEGSAAHTVGEVGKGIANLGSYLIPGAGQARLVSDVGGVVGQSIQTSSAKPLEEAGQAIVDSFKVLDRDIPLSERILRWVNVGGAALGGAYLGSRAGRANAIRATAAALKREAKGVPELAKLSDKDFARLASEAVSAVAKRQGGLRTAASPLATARNSVQHALDTVRQRFAPRAESNPGGVPAQARPGDDYNRAFADLPDAQPGNPQEILTGPDGEPVAQPRAVGAPRPAVEPVQGGQAANPESLIDQLARDLRTSTPDTTRPFTRGALGEYDPNSTAKRLRWGNDLDTAAHELGHHLDNVQGLLSKADDAVKAELDELGKRTSMDGYTPEQVRQEGLAEAVRDLALAPGHLDGIAPATAKFLRDNLTPEQLAAVQRYGKGVREYAGASATDRMRAQIRFEEPEAGTTWWQKLADGVVGWKRAWDAEGQYRVSGKTQLAALLVDESAPLKQAWRDAMRLVGHNPDEVLPSQDVAGLIDDMRYVRGKVGDILEHGMTDAQGNRVGVPLRAIFERLWTGDETALEKDFRDAMTLGVAERVLERADKLARDAQGEVAAARERILRDLRQLRADIRSQWEREVSIARVGHKPGTKRVEAKIAKLTKDRDAALERARRDAKREFERLRERKLREAQRQADSLVGTDAGVGAGKAPEQARKAIEELSADAARYERLKASLEAYRQHADALLKYALEKGRIKQATYDAVKRDNDLYVAMRRVLGDDDGGPVFEPGPNLGRVSEFLHRFKGSKKTVENPVKSLVEQTAKVVRESDRNAVMVKFTEALKGNAGGAELASIGRRVNRDYSGRKYKVVRDGEVEFWAFQEDIANALDAIAAPGTQAKGLEWAFVAMARTIRFTATSSPRYLVRNFIRDTVDRAVRRPGERIRLSTPEEVSDYHRLGGGLGQSELVDGARTYYDIQARIMDEIAGRQSKSVVVRKYSQLREASERANRLAEMRRAYKEAISKGMSEHDAKLYAARSARELLDFAKGGKWTGNRVGIGRYVPFLNSSIQGMNALARDFMRSPAKVGGRFLGKIATTELAVYAWNTQQGAIEEWRQQPAYLKDFFWLVKVPGRGFLTIPKPFETGVLASAFSRAYDSAAGNEHALDGYAGGLDASLTQSLLGPATNIAEGGGAQGIIGVVTNKDLFRGQYIVPPHEEKLRMDLRDGKADASRAAQLLQRALPGVDPRQIDFILQGQGGDYGRTLAYLSDLGREDKGIATPERLVDVVAGLAKESPGTNAQDVQWVMRQAASVGLRGALKAERDAVRRARTGPEREAAKTRLIGRAKLLRKRIEKLTEGKSGEQYEAAVKVALGW